MLWHFNWSIQILFGNILRNLVIMNKVGKFAWVRLSVKFGIYVRQMTIFGGIR